MNSDWERNTFAYLKNNTVLGIDKNYQYRVLKQRIKNFIS